MLLLDGDKFGLCCGLVLFLIILCLGAAGDADFPGTLKRAAAGLVIGYCAGYIISRAVSNAIASKLIEDRLKKQERMMEETKKE